MGGRASDNPGGAVVPGMTGFRLRPAQPGDHPTFARLFLELETGDAVPDPARFASHLVADVAIAEVDGAPAGYVYVQVLETTGYVRHLVIDPASRRRGVGRRVLDEVGGRFRAAGCTRWCLNVKPDNGPARALYEACGMRIAHATEVVRMAWGDERHLPRGDAPARVLDPREERAFEDRFGVPRGLLSAGRATGKVAIGVGDGLGPRGLASFDPAFPGAFPFGAASPADARALLEACRDHRVPIDDAEHRWRTDGFQVVVEHDAALVGSLVTAGGRVVLETLHYVGEL